MSQLLSFLLVSFLSWSCWFHLQVDSVKVYEEGRESLRCCYMSRQYDHQVLVYSNVPNPLHPKELKLESGTDIASFSAGNNPSGIAVKDDLVYVASYGTINGFFSFY